MMIPDRVVFDAEPLIAHADGEPRSEVVETYLDAVAAKDTTGFASYVNLAEIRYTLARKYDRDTADEYLDWLTDLGIEPVDVSSAWMDASEYILQYNPALGDAFALATAEHIEATLLIGGDDDYDDISNIPIERFREGSA
ncbi:Predicted nucleic acid-binding protein, contains PIN domain [Haloplanus vescus]|uniref:Predicted nucleic acid-binding protein, contains PIN domain n=1 Tax=Haloplanus vescus TaxID=555874 RepID=A0A1H4AVN4_9EURY|nr:PIN domain-containing protein [Haloplanus vescus]SEA39898.1 Predicted nucleic acid-binding protein, contains PIN domain [Haloplanus vescus]